MARVGPETLTLGEFERQYRIFVGRLVNRQGVPYSDEVLPYFAEYRPQILDQIVRQRGILQLAAAAGVKSDTAKVDAAVQESRQDFESDAEFADALKSAGYENEAQFRANVQEALVSNDYLAKLRDRFKFNDAVVAQYYRSHVADYRRAAEACVKHILVKDDAAAKTVQDRLKAGEDFAKVAADVSLDPGSKDKGGDLGCFEQGVTVPEFDRASFTGPLNVVQQVKSEFGTHVLIVSKRTQAGVAPQTEVDAEIRRTLADDAAQKYVTSQLARIRTEKFADRVATAAPAPEKK